MSRNPAKDFAAIADDYSFFEIHSTEAEEVLQAYKMQLADWQPHGDRVRMRDFGCGSGTFTAELLDAVGWPADRLELTLVDPAEKVRRQAVGRLARFTSHPMVAESSLPRESESSFDFILANHVFYYVPALTDRLRELTAAIAPGGLLLSAIAGSTNPLHELWKIAFEDSGRETPYYAAEDVYVALDQLEVAYDKREIPYHIGFDDTHENRLKIIRFFLADHLSEAAVDPLVAMFNKYSRAGRIEIDTTCDYVTVRH